MINARIDVFLGPLLAGAGPGTQEELVPEALRRANAYLEAGVDCVYPIVLWETDALRRFIAEVRGPVNVVRMPPAPSVAELAALGVARVSWGTSCTSTRWLASGTSSLRFRSDRRIPLPTDDTHHTSPSRSPSECEVLDVLVGGVLAGQAAAGYRDRAVSGVHERPQRKGPT